jgi:hypothetical protein
LFQSGKQGKASREAQKKGKKVSKSANEQAYKLEDNNDLGLSTVQRGAADLVWGTGAMELFRGTEG